MTLRSKRWGLTSKYWMRMSIQVLAYWCMTYCNYSTIVMHELFSLQIDIDALNHRSSPIVYSPGSAVSKLRVPKTSHIGGSSHLNLRHVSTSDCWYFRFSSSGQVLTNIFGVRCSLPVVSIVRVFSASPVARIRAPFPILLLRHDASPDPFVYRSFNISVTLLPTAAFPPIAPESVLIEIWLPTAINTHKIHIFNVILYHSGPTTKQCVNFGAE